MTSKTPLLFKFNHSRNMKKKEMDKTKEQKERYLIVLVVLFGLELRARVRE